MQQYFNRAIQFLIDGVGASTAFVPLFAGQEDCLPEHHFGPYIRDYYIIHFCRRGRGEITDKRGTHKVKEGDMFIIRPDEVTVYTADREKPWHYYWIAFRGERAALFDTERTVYRSPEGVTERIRMLCESAEASPDIYVALLHELVYHLFSKSEPQNHPLSVAERYVEYNYYKSDLSVEEIAAACGYERSHLYRLFKQKRGAGIKEYVTSVRMTRADEFLDRGYTVKTTAELVGYSDPFSFSRAYKNYYGTSPSEAKKSAKM